MVLKYIVADINKTIEVHRMNNPWETVSLKIYESHMALSGIRQTQMLNAIMKQQLNEYAVKSVAIWGVAGGNGLQHIDLDNITKVYGIDINQEYLDTCKARYGNMNGCLQLMRADLQNTTAALPCVDLIIANLLLEYIGIPAFIEHLKTSMPKLVSCVIQQNENASFVSPSPYTDSLAVISDLHKDIDRSQLIRNMEQIHAPLICEEEFPLPNHKKFIRLDFACP